MGKETFDKGIKTEILMDLGGRRKFQFCLLTLKVTLNFAKYI
jgi:hypothetical protein